MLVALIVIFGHLIVFFAGFMLLGVMTQELSTDFLQIVLMGSPVLAATSIAAVKYVLVTETEVVRGDIVNLTFTTIVVAIPLLLIAAILALFLVTYYRFEGFDLDKLKISVGVVETAFAAFMTAISDRLFGAADKSITASVLTVHELHKK